MKMGKEDGSFFSAKNALKVVAGGAFALAALHVLNELTKGKKVDALGLAIDAVSSFSPAPGVVKEALEEGLRPQPRGEIFSEIEHACKQGKSRRPQHE